MKTPIIILSIIFIVIMLVLYLKYRFPQSANLIDGICCMIYSVLLFIGAALLFSCGANLIEPLFKK